MSDQSLSTFPSWVYSSAYRGPFKSKILIADLAKVEDGQYTDISSHVTNVSVNYTMDLASELSFDIIDPKLLMSDNNYFITARDVIYETQTIGQIEPYSSNVRLVMQIFEMSNISVSQGPGGSVTYSIKCYTKAIQQMKRDKKPGLIKGSGTAFIRNAAKKYGLEAYCQQTSKSQSVKSSGEKQKESLWNVMDRLAGDANFVLFEVDGILIFGSEEWLMHKWGTEKKITIKDVKRGSKKDLRDKKKDGKLKKTEIWVPLQFPNDGPGYIGTPGRFTLTQYPSLTKSDNDPREGEGSCIVERINGTQLRPGMTAYVGNIPNMSGFFLIDSVSFNEMTPDAVTVNFRTPKRDEKKYKIRDLPIGKIYPSTILSQNPPRISTIEEAAVAASGRAIVRQGIDSRILPIPTASSPATYPSMEYANITLAYPMIADDITEGKPDSQSTNDRYSIVSLGNLDLYNRPILPYSLPGTTPDPYGVHTTYSITHVFAAGSEYRAVLLPTIYTEGGVAVMKTNAEVVAQYNAAGGYLGSAKHLGVLSGATEKKAILNARDYGWLILQQQQEILEKRFPQYGYNFFLIPNTPGGANSNW